MIKIKIKIIKIIHEINQYFFDFKKHLNQQIQ